MRQGKGPESAVTIILVDRRNLFRECIMMGLRRSAPGLTVHASSSLDGAARFLGSPNEHRLVLYNIASQPVTDEHLSKEISAAVAAFHPVPLAILADRNDAELVENGLRLGARGYIWTGSSLDTALKAIHLIVGGGVYRPESKSRKPRWLGTPTARSPP